MVPAVRKFQIRGLTLVELLIVGSILAVLLTITVLVFLQSQPQRGRDARRKADLSKIQVKLEDYYNDRNCYPFSIYGDEFKPYMDPISQDPDGSPYSYYPEQVTCPSFYRMYTTLEYEKDAIIEKLGCTSGCGPSGTYTYGVSSANVGLETGTGGGGGEGGAGGGGGGGAGGGGGGGSGGGGSTQYYGCQSGVCTVLSGPVCAPNYLDANCFGQCGTPADPRNECQ